MHGEEEGRGAGGKYDNLLLSYSSFRSKVMGLIGVSSSLSAEESGDDFGEYTKASRWLVIAWGSVETTIRQSRSESFLFEDCGMTSARAVAVGRARAIIEGAARMHGRRKGYKKREQKQRGYKVEGGRKVGRRYVSGI